jgi:tripartite-type tricarboxylate transporter receptor subunit TctC
MAIAAMGVAGATAQTYPDRPIKLIVPFPPGGPPDAIARVIGDDVGKRINQTVVIDNRQGAGATIGSRAVAAAELTVTRCCSPARHRCRSRPRCSRTSSTIP